MGPVAQGGDPAWAGSIHRGVHVISFLLALIALAAGDDPDLPFPILLGESWIGKPQEEPLPRPNRESLAFDWVVAFSPDRDLYLTYLADPRQSRSGSKVQFPLRRDDREDNVKIENVLGGHRPLVGWSDPAHPEVEMQLLIEAAVFSRFDIGEAWDLDAADYRFGFPFLYRVGEVVLKIHPYHITSHLGDEFISREGRKRDSYHLDELAVGVSSATDAPWRIYAELGIAVYTGPETSSGRAQVGAEYFFAPISERVTPFVALDLQTRNEIDWSWNAAAMVGLMLAPKSGDGHGLRGTLEYYRGNDVQTQFKSDREQFLALGFAADF